MELIRFLTLALRALLVHLQFPEHPDKQIHRLIWNPQLFCSIVIIALSIATTNFLAKFTEAGYDPPVSPVQYRFAVFVGAWGIIDAGLGIVAEFVAAIPWIAVLVVDGLAGTFFLSGGVKLVSMDEMRKYGSCSKDYWHEDEAVNFCKETKSDYAFMFFCLVIVVALVGLGFLRRRAKTVSASGGV
ncbi:hypothetical protein KC332_g2032 [Hortaea werneckii]|nr:hypothetical protein KC358_g2012 [Hortaea werneckii]KAI6942667.1 hypothetical protein KC341_g2054 [Hortaea werneckii]KAI6948470.1 hypothetical protein KC348_g1889 [Hortaea werneckii]KAI6980513.1 hypothetical protein KC321_g1730 [Hortaea werneckii]KAI6995112.1 hypothetical protein KC329_g2533 [Hortaea werneckii]